MKKVFRNMLSRNDVCYFFIALVSIILFMVSMSIFFSYPFPVMLSSIILVVSTHLIGGLLLLLQTQKVIDEIAVDRHKKIKKDLILDERLAKHSEALFEYATNKLQSPMAEAKKIANSASNTDAFHSERGFTEFRAERIQYRVEMCKNRLDVLGVLHSNSTNQFRTDTSPIDLKDFTADLEAIATKLIGPPSPFPCVSKDVVVKATYELNAFIKSNRAVLYTLGYELITNAVNASGLNGCILIDSCVEEGQLLIEMLNTGKKLPDYYLDRLNGNLGTGDETFEANGQGIASIVNLTQCLNGKILAKSIPKVKRHETLIQIKIPVGMIQMPAEMMAA